MNILVTGGSGFLGSALCLKLLSLGHVVSYLSRNESIELKYKNIKWFKGDIADTSFINETLKDVEVVFHVAALAGYWGKHEDFYNVNIRGTENILNACRKYQIKYLVYTSSPSIVFDKKDILGSDESLPIPKKHLCSYSETKAIAEKMILNANDNNLKTIALRPHLIYGPGDNHLLPRVIRKIKEGKMAIIGDGSNKVDMIYIENAVMGHIQALEAMMKNQDCSGQSYFLTDDNPVKLWVWVNALAAALNIQPIKRKIPISVAYFLGYFIEILYRILPFKGEPPMTRFVAYSLGKNHYFDISKAKKKLKYRVVVSSEEAFKRTCDFLKQFETNGG